MSGCQHPVVKQQMSYVDENDTVVYPGFCESCRRPVEQRSIVIDGRATLSKWEVKS